MKIVVIGDIHGKPIWKQLLEPHIKSADVIIFIGDYVDAWKCDNHTMITNLENIIQFKKDNMEKVELLLGNHDIQYMYYPKYRCSGFRNEIAFTLGELFYSNKDLFKVAYGYTNDKNQYLFTHAGISQVYFYWLMDQIAGKDDFDRMEFEAYLGKPSDTQYETFADYLNAIAQTHYRDWLFAVSPVRGGHFEPYGGIVWADKTETQYDMLEGYHQVVGHTPVDKITTITNGFDPITYIDCLDSNPEVYILEV